MLSIFKPKASREDNVATNTRTHDVCQVYLVDSPMTHDWVETQIISCNPKNGYLVFQQNQFTYCSKNHSIVIEENRLSHLFANSKAGWSRKATLDELVIMTDVCPELNRELGDLVVLLKNGYDLADYPHPKRAKKIAEIMAKSESISRTDSSYFKT